MMQVSPRLTLGWVGGFSGGRWSAPGADGTKRNVSMNYLGARAAFAFVHRRRLDVGVDGLLAFGTACLDRGERDSHGHIKCRESANMLVTSPRIFANYRLGRFVRVGVAAGYRFATRRRMWPGENLSFSGPFAALTFDFGAWGS
jgi:hypothetical protein